MKLNYQNLVLEQEMHFGKYLHTSEKVILLNNDTLIRRYKLITGSDTVFEHELVNSSSVNCIIGSLEVLEVAQDCIH